MSSCKLPDSLEKRVLIHFLRVKIEECNSKIKLNAGLNGITQEQSEYKTKKSVYEEILGMIR